VQQHHTKKTAVHFSYYALELDTTITALQEHWSISVDKDTTWPQHIITTSIDKMNKTTFMASLAKHLSDTFE
jgi:hypothetical protein